MESRISKNNDHQYGSFYNISPWEEQHKIPDFYLNSIISQSKKKKNKLKQIQYPIKKQDNYTSKRNHRLKSQPLLISNNQSNQFLQCVQFSWINNQINEKFKPSNSKEHKIIVARKRAKNGLQIKSIKKKILNSQEINDKHFNFFNDEVAPLKNKFRLITESKLNLTTNIRRGQNSYQSKKKSKRLHTTQNMNFPRQFLTQISTIATISNQKRRGQKCKTQQSTQDWKKQRELFLQTNTKFKQWQSKTKKTISSSITLPINLM